MSEVLAGPLEERHRQLGASFAEFGGWLMPVSYAGTVSEHTATRTTVGLFDVSHLGKALVRGPGAAEYVNSALTNDLRRIGPGKAQYTLCCTDSGGVIDDLIAYYVSDDEIFLVPNAANTAGGGGRAGRARARPGSRSPTSTGRTPCWRCRDRSRPRCVGALGLPTDMDYMGYADAEFGGVQCGCAAPVTPANTATSCCHRGIRRQVVFDALVERGRVPPAVNSPGSAPATRCAPRWAIRCTATNCRWRSRPCRRAAVGPSGGRRTRSGAATRCWPRRKPARSGCCAGCGRVGRGVLRARPHGARRRQPVGVTTSGTFSPTLKVGIALALVDAIAEYRRRPARRGRRPGPRARV